MSISGANTIPLRKLNPILTGERTFSGPSLLRPSMSASRPTAMQAMQMVGPRPNAMQMVGPRPNAMQMVGPRPNAMQMVGPRPNAMQMLGPRPNAMMVGPRPNMVQPQQMLMAPQLPPMPVMAQKHDVQETLNAIQHHGTPLQRKREVEDPSSDRKKKRRSRWGGDDKDKAFIPGMPTILPPDIKPEQEKAYLLQLQIEEITRRLRSGDLGISPNPEDRSPSPEPIYNNEGKRLNTREYRTRKKLEEERHTLILEIALYNPEFKPPSDYKPPIIRVNDKVMIPQEEHPEINFVGLLIGPRGNTLKNLEKDTGAKIIIRGKGSVKEGKIGRKDGQPLPGEDEPLHAYITANNPESVNNASQKIKDIIKQGIEVPEGQNDLRRMQLRELALLNGTLREADGPRCSNCGANAHRSWQCPEKVNVTNNVICTNCGGVGHIASDCREKRPGLGGPPPRFPPPGGIGGPQLAADKAKIDEEYMSLMAELGEGPPPPAPKPSPAPHYRPNYGSPFGGRGMSDGGPPRPLMPPPSSGGSHPPQLMSKESPQWNQHGRGPPGGHQGVPPSLMSMATAPPWASQQGGGGGGQGQQGGGGAGAAAAVSSNNVMGVPPPSFSVAPPPPPPSSQAVQYPWMTSTAGGTSQAPPISSPWNQGYSGASGIPPWQGSGMMGVPPPVPPPMGVAPPPPPPTSGGAAPQVNAFDFSALAAVGLPSLLAPPPPPPS